MHKFISIHNILGNIISSTVQVVYLKVPYKKVEKMQGPVLFLRKISFYPSLPYSNIASQISIHLRIE